MSDSPSATSTLRGTPVVPGVAYGPALLVRGEVSPDAIARFDGSAYDEERALAAYDDAAIAVAEGFARRADKASDAAAEVLTASAGLARDKGLRSAVRKRLTAGDDLLASVHAGVEQFVSVFSSMGGLMAERVTDLRDIERRVVAHLVGEPEPGVQMPDRPAVLWQRTSLRRTRRRWTPRSCWRWSPSGAGRPATPRSSPGSSRSPAWSVRRVR